MIAAVTFWEVIWKGGVVVVVLFVGSAVAAGTWEAFSGWRKKR